MEKQNSKKLEVEGTTENSSQLQKSFCDGLRKKFHDTYPSCTLPQLEKVNKGLTALAQQISQIFGADGKAVFELLGKLPPEQIQKLSQFGAEWLNSSEKDLRDDIQSLGEPDITNGYMGLLLDFFNRKQRDNVALGNDQGATTNDQGATTNDQGATTNDKDKLNNNKNTDKIDDNFEQNRELLKQALQDKEAVQKDPQASQHFNTPEFRQRRQRVALELEARPGFKASVEKTFGQGVATADLADMILTRAVIQENNIKTDSGEKFMKSYDALDGLLRFGYYGAGELGKNQNILYNKSYTRLIDNPKPNEVMRLDPENLSNNLTALQLAAKSNPALVNEEFIKSFTTAMENNDGEALRKLQEQYPQQFAEIGKVKSEFEMGLTKCARIDALMTYNDFVGGLFGEVKSTKTGTNSMMVKTGDESLAINDSSMSFGFNSLGLNGKFAIENGEIMMTNLFKKGQAANQYTAGLDRLPIEQFGRVPTAQQILGEITSQTGGQGVDELFKGLTDIKDLQNPNSEFRQKLTARIHGIVQKQMGELKKGDMVKIVGEYTEKYRHATKLVSLYEPKQWQYRYQEGGEPIVDKTNAKSQRFYNYLDALNNTFYDQSGNVTAARMADFTRKVEELINTRRISPEQFFQMFAADNQGGGFSFVETRPGTSEKVIDLEKFDQYVRMQTAPSLIATKHGGVYN